jgi:hypothetical protein
MTRHNTQSGLGLAPCSRARALHRMSAVALRWSTKQSSKQRPQNAPCASCKTFQVSSSTHRWSRPETGCLSIVISTRSKGLRIGLIHHPHDVKSISSSSPSLPSPSFHSGLYLCATHSLCLSGWSQGPPVFQPNQRDVDVECFLIAKGLGLGVSASGSQMESWTRKGGTAATTDLRAFACARQGAESYLATRVLIGLAIRRSRNILFQV